MLNPTPDDKPQCSHGPHVLVATHDELIALIEGMIRGDQDNVLVRMVSRRANAAEIARAVARQPGLSYNRHAIGSNDEILDQSGPTGYRLQDFISDADLATYREMNTDPEDVR